MSGLIGRPSPAGGWGGERVVQRPARRGPAPASAFRPRPDRLRRRSGRSRPGGMRAGAWPARISSRRERASTVGCSASCRRSGSTSCARGTPARTENEDEALNVGLGRIGSPSRGPLGVARGAGGDGYLPAEQRVALLLVTVEGLSYKEAADVAEVPVGTIMSRLARARLALQAKLEAGGALRRSIGRCKDRVTRR